MFFGFEMIYRLDVFGRGGVNKLRTAEWLFLDVHGQLHIQGISELKCTLNLFLKSLQKF